MLDRRRGLPLLVLLLFALAPAVRAQEPGTPGTVERSRPLTVPRPEGEETPASPLAVDLELDDRPPGPPEDADAPGPAAAPTPAVPGLPVDALVRNAGAVAVVSAISLVPAAVLMLTAFVRISVVLLLLRQALGNPQVPGNQAMTALALMLTVLVMWPVGERVHRDAIEPLSRGRVDAGTAWAAASGPILGFMAGQIDRAGHNDYVRTLYEHAVPASAGRAMPESIEECPFHVVAPAFLISELTTAFRMGFALFLPFLVLDLVVASVLSAMGLFLLPPTLVALPLKLGVFVLADGWLLVSDMLIRSFGTG
jgi:flagellar biosynthetic protein FliP